MSVLTIHFIFMTENLKIDSTAKIRTTEECSRPNSQCRHFGCERFLVGKLDVEFCMQFIPTQLAFRTKMATSWVHKSPWTTLAYRLPVDSSSPQHLLDHVAWHVVDEQAQNSHQQQEKHQLDYQPAVLVTDQVLHRFEWDQEPQQRNIRAAGGRR